MVIAAQRFIAGVAMAAGALGWVVGAGPIGPAAAQTGTTAAEMIGAWEIRCETPPGAPSEICAMLQIVNAQDRQNISLAVAIRKLTVQENGQARQLDLLRIQTPLGLLLPSGVGLLVDGEQVGRVPYTRCVPNRCVVELPLTPELLARFKAGNDAIFTVFQTPEEGIGIPISLNGFSAAYDRLK
ncbi:MAG: invasion associated locus B family protein [Pseudomonadota bacterium]